MNPRTSVFILVSALAVAALSLIFFTLDGGFGGRGHGFGETIPRSLWLVLIVASLIAAMLALVYYMVFPEISEKKPRAEQFSPAVEKEELTLEAVL